MQSRRTGFDTADVFPTLRVCPVSNRVPDDESIDQRWSAVTARSHLFWCFSSRCLVEEAAGIRGSTLLTGASGLATRAIQHRKEVVRRADNQLQRLGVQCFQ
ncbi:hypothetical protein SynA1560_02066 [Synechococcus sp. A15-60]|nr:hypothetical protein SynA1560_02066 [Synechococcus sp. A15-60]